MAKRYARLNWQNKPSVATPVSAANLNRMDKGIDDLDTYKIDTDAIVNNGVTTVAGTVLDGRMGKALQDQVTTINNNLAKCFMTYINDTSVTWINHAINQFDNMQDQSHRFFMIRSSDGNAFALIMRFTAGNGVILKWTLSGVHSRYYKAINEWREYIA